ncbi:Uncharacterised protein [Oligella urethralis]|uniref:portal protein n=1 Tax=Oligella urethralis TaxID=90245 RepID=UPI000E05FD15|nr:chromosome partitioning protein ParB [Oligella urethralis]SUA63329.1 Uncharacterised protein [Oligella urethralis]
MSNIQGNSILNVPDSEIDQVPLETVEAPDLLVDWENPPKLRDLKQDYEEAKPYHSSQVTKIQGWLDNLLVEGKAKIDVPDGNSRIVPKLIRKQAEWRYAALSEPFLSTGEIFNVRPVTWEDKEAAYHNELILSHQFNSQLDKTRFIDEFVRTVVDEGTAFIKVGWEYEDEEYETTQPIIEFIQNPEFAETIEQIHGLRTESPSQYDTDVSEELKQAYELSMQTGVPVEPIVIGEEPITKTRILKNQPSLEICDYKNVIVDPTCSGDMDKASFVIHSFAMSLSDLAKDTRYRNIEHIRIDADGDLVSSYNEEETYAQAFTFKDKPRKKVTVYEYWGYWDIDGTGLVKPIVAAWVGDVMIRLEENPYPDQKIPFVAVQYLPVRKSIYGEPDGALLEDNQAIIGAVTRGMIDVMGKSANGQTGIAKGLLDVTNRRKFERGMDYEFNPHSDPRQAIYMHTYPEIPQSAQFMLQLQNMEAESLTGVKSFSQGISQSSLGNVATAVRGALDAASKRELGILRRLADGIIKVGKKIISMNSEFLSEEEVVRVTNEEFIQVRRSDLAGTAGDFDLRLSISTAEEDNNKAEELGFMMQTLGNSMGMELMQIVLADIADLRKMPDLAKQIRSYAPQPDPFQEAMKELELQMAQAKIEVELAKAAQMRASAGLAETKVGTEMAKAANLQSDTDMKDLDFVEQEMGVKHERDKELRAEQAKSQAELKMIDNAFQSQKSDDDFAKELVLNAQNNEFKERTARFKDNNLRKRKYTKYDN